MRPIFDDDRAANVLHILSTTVIAPHIYQSLNARQKAGYEWHEQIKRYVEKGYRLSHDELRRLSRRGDV